MLTVLPLSHPCSCVSQSLPQGGFFERCVSPEWDSSVAGFALSVRFFAALRMTGREGLTVTGSQGLRVTGSEWLGMTATKGSLRVAEGKGLGMAGGDNLGETRGEGLRMT